MQSVDRRQSRPGRWVPLLLYGVVVVGWFADALSDEIAREHLWLALWTLPAPALYLWRTRRRG